MTEQDVGADIAHPARGYDYWPGGTDNFDADRAAAEQVVRFMPLVLVSCWRPEGGEPGPDADRAWAYGGVASV
jgi:S-adenosyl methyltransferase